MDGEQGELLQAPSEDQEHIRKANLRSKTAPRKSLGPYLGTVSDTTKRDLRASAMAEIASAWL